VITLPSPGGAYSLSGVDVAANGTDYLVAWIEGAFCAFPCVGVPSRILALRLRADATTIDPAPLSLDGDQRFQFGLSVASAGGRWLVTWSGGENVVRATRISAEGAVLDRDAQGGGVVIEPGNTNDTPAVVAAARIGSRFALVIRHFVFTPLTGVTVRTLSGLTFDPHLDLNSVAALPRVPLAATTGNEALPTIAVASRGPLLAFAYSRIADGEAGGVSRAFVRILSEPPPRRRASAH